MSAIHPFDQTQSNILIEHFNSSRQSSDSITYWEAVGFLFVVACSPELIPPSHWLPIVYNTQDDESSMKSAQTTLGAFMALYNELDRQVQSSNVGLLPGCELRTKPIDNLEPGAPISQWSSGFIHGYDWLQEVWTEYVPDEFDEEIGSQMLVLSFFANVEIAKDFVKESKVEDLTIETMATNIQPLFIDTMRNFALLGYSIQQALLEQDYAPQQPIRSEKVGRNAPCTCGSGKKYKKCCGVAR